jgi:hypothetical protein
MRTQKLITKPICEVCGVEEDTITKCKTCGIKFCEYCGSVEERKCIDCLDNDEDDYDDDDDDNYDDNEETD